MSKPVAIVTGAGKGIGRAIARELRRRGHELMLVARTEADLRETDEGALHLSGDVADPELPQQVVALAMKHFGRVDVLVNNAGYAPLKPFEQFDFDDLRRIVDVNLTATILLCRAVWPVMQKQKGGVIVNISSAASRDPFQGLGTYGAAKAGVNLLGHALAREGDPYGIRVHTIAPGAVETSMLRSIITQEQYGQERTLDPADVARAVVACIDGDLRHTSGEVIHLHQRLS